RLKSCLYRHTGCSSNGIHCTAAIVKNIFHSTDQCQFILIPTLPWVGIAEKFFGFCKRADDVYLVERTFSSSAHQADVAGYNAACSNQAFVPDSNISTW